MVRRRRRVALAVAIVAVVGAGGAVAATRAQHPPATSPQIAPGALAVPQPTVAQLCTPGYTATIRPPSAYTTVLKIRQMKAWHLPGTPADYEEDHLVALELGGAPMDERNLWPEPWPDAHKKDAAENAWHASVCAGRATLAQAQGVFLRDEWSRVSAP